MKSEHDFKYPGDWKRYQRQYYAGLAMNGLISNLSGIRREGFKDSEIAEFCVIMANNLIAELNKEIKP